MTALQRNLCFDYSEKQTLWASTWLKNTAVFSWRRYFCSWRIEKNEIRRFTAVCTCNWSNVLWGSCLLLFIRYWLITRFSRRSWSGKYQLIGRVYILSLIGESLCSLLSNCMPHMPQSKMHLSEDKATLHEVFHILSRTYKNNSSVWSKIIQFRQLYLRWFP